MRCPMRDNESCPSVEVLRQLALGEMTTPEAESLERHLEQCERCIALLEELPVEDGLVRVMRAGSPIPARIDRPAVDQLIGRIRKIPLTSLADAPTTVNVSIGGATLQQPSAAAGVAQEMFDFLSPPETPDELGRLGE